MPLPEKLHLEIVTPERRVLAKDVDEVILPGAEGSFGVLPGHAPLLAALGPGVAVVKALGKQETLAISGGFAEVGPERVTVLAETAERAEEVDKDRARRKLEELGGKLRTEIPAGDEVVLRLRIAKQVARITAAERAL